MSRNRSERSCYWCNGAIKAIEDPRPIRPEDCFARWFHEYEGLIVAHAECELCKAPYLGWIDGTRNSRLQWPHPETDENGKLRIIDTSHRYSFNDEPSPKDYPKFKVETTVTHTLTPWPTCDRCGGAMEPAGRYEREQCADFRCVRLSEGWIDCPKHGHGPNDKRCDDCWMTGMVKPKEST